MDGDWLPPEPPGEPPPPPDRPPPYPGQPPQPQPPQAPPAYQPQAPPQPPPYQQPPPGYGQSPPGYPPPQYPQPGFPPPAYHHPVYTPQPANNDAVAGFTCAVIGAALLFFSAGLSTIVSLVLGIVAIPYARKGKRAIAEGKTQKHKDLANAGYVLGIVTIILSALAILGWILFFALIDWDSIEDTDDDPLDEDFQYQVVLRVLAVAARLVC